MNSQIILVFNAGSSSIRYALYDMTNEQLLVSGNQEGIGGRFARWHHLDSQSATGDESGVVTTVLKDHNAGFNSIIGRLLSTASGRKAPAPDGIGHRVVHGGDLYDTPVRIDDTVVHGLRKISHMAPLHNQSSLDGIELVTRSIPDIPQVAVFDTAFHATMPAYAARYALPRDWYRDYGVRRYGFHGISHACATREAAERLGVREQTVNLITLHLGSGASVAAIRNGICVDTSMGMTPLEGLIMGTRCGDIDPAIPGYLARNTGLSYDSIESVMNSQSGLLGLCGTADMREVHHKADSGDADAVLARDMFCYRIKKYLGAYLAILGRVDGIVFTGGIGENDAVIRTRICDGLEHLGIRLDPDLNKAAPAGNSLIHLPGAGIPVMVIRANEALAIARTTRQVLSNIPDR